MLLGARLRVEVFVGAFLDVVGGAIIVVPV